MHCTYKMCSSMSLRDHQREKCPENLTMGDEAIVQDTLSGLQRDLGRSSNCLVTSQIQRESDFQCARVIVLRAFIRRCCG
jgi:hypothetical protein